MKTKNKKSLHLLIGFWLLLLTSPMFGQQQSTITGKITDGTYAAVPGATISVKGTTSGVVSNEKGEFVLKFTQNLPVTLVVSFVGYKTQEYDVYDIEPLSIVLEEDVNRINAVVVIGYGTKKREELTGSVASIAVSGIKQSAISSFDNALQGKAAGVQVIQTSGQPGAAISVRIRGGNSINGGNEPLYVIDGFPVYNDNNDANSGAISGASINALASLNPSDIESIDVLKDASGTAIYGSRGANGVVQITTKKGKAGRTQITYDTYYGTQTIGKKIPLLNAQQFGILRNDAIETSNDVVRKTGSGVIKDLYYTTSQIDSLGNIHTNWEDAAFRQAPVQNHQITITGGDEKSHYALSGNYYNQEGIVINSNFQRFAGRLNFDRKITEKFKITENLTVSQISANEAPDGILNTVLAVRPDFPIYNADGSFTYKQPGEAALGNPIATLVEQENSTKTFRLLGNANGEYKFFDGLTAKVSFGIDRIHNNQYRYIPTTLAEGNSIGYANRGSKTVNTWLNENTLNYVKKVGVHAFDILLGYTQQQNNTNSFVSYASGFSNDLLQDNDLGSGTTLVAPSSLNTAWSLQSILGRLNYGFKEKYYFTATIRADGSSRFGKNHKWGYFPSAAVSWAVNKENFLKNITFITNAKLRLSVGQTGNQEIGVYQSLANQAYYSYIVGDKLVAGYAPARIANPDLTWETTTQYDGGFDLGVLKDRISINFDAYYKKTTDLLLTVPIPATSGQLTALQNYGSVENKGLEVAVSTENFNGKFKWNTNISYSLNRNKILSLGDGVSYINNYTTDGTFISKVGEPVGSYYVYLTNGVFQATDDIDNLPSNKTPSLPGYQRYKDINKDGKIGLANDRVIAGNAQPKFIFGITNNLSYGIFDLSFLFQGSYGNKIYNYTANYLNLGTGYTNATTLLLNRWTPDNTDTDVPRAIQDPAPLASDRYIEDGSYIRLKSLSFGITIPKKWIHTTKISNLRVYISGQNLITWTNYTGFDPEGGRNEQATATQGYDNAVYPVSKTYIAGLSLTF
jgi:TonB-linked SusC/RagA family outer membrane protein